MALEIGIVGLPSSGKTTLFRALTRAEATGSGKEHVGMAQIADERLDALAKHVGARKVTPAAVRVVDVPGHRPAAAREPPPGRRAARGARRLLRDVRSRRRPRDAEARAARRRSRPRGEAPRAGREAGEVGRREGAAEAAELERLLAHVDAGHTLAEWDGELSSELDPLTTKPLISIVNGPDGIDLQLESELADLSDEEAAEFRGGGESALGEVVRRLAETLDLITFFTAGEKETRAWTLRRGETALDAAATIHSDIARGFIRAEVTRTDDFLAGGQARLEGKNYVVEDGDVLNIRFNV